jgi:hypothetical protein
MKTHLPRLARISDSTTACLYVCKSKKFISVALAVANQRDEARSPSSELPATASRGSAEPVQGGGDLPERSSAGGLSLANSGRGGIGEPVSAGLVAALAMRGLQPGEISVRIELMADCLAGVWAANADQKWHILDPGDVEKALATAQALGDDRLQSAARGFAVPDSLTHGTSALRQQWLTTGLKSGQVDSCNTFAG